MFMFPTVVNSSEVKQPLKGFIFEGTVSSSSCFPAWDVLINEADFTVVNGRSA